VQQVAQDLHDFRQQPIHALRQRLHHEVVAIAIDHQRREQVRFAVHQAIRCGLDFERIPELDRRLDSPAHQLSNRGGVAIVIERQRANGDLRLLLYSATPR